MVILRETLPSTLVAAHDRARGCRHEYSARSEFHYSEAITYVHAYELPLRAVAGTCHSCGTANQGTRDVGGEDGTKKGREIEGREEEVMR